ncbi:hypothetical protein BCR37DRAFT_128008 [Protomyces lactucae-debilis]|uniref:Uncharacterized protein n=1 Tax=Protomyces lactucae-debilis TaxID=2754530 RepID=A0A1Y2FW26_PROLT|nr:uncharacterized protein BCR37DRAFT_128008 [Protomyces lactucae-debilis]ORY86875.1 hypothetical protein BCR37DRAFT_128008 [Protomyces lactucae-debilis]
MFAFRVLQVYQLLALVLILESWYWRIGPMASYKLTLLMSIPTYSLVHVFTAKNMDDLGFLHRHVLPNIWLSIVADKKFAFAEYRVREVFNWMPAADNIGYDWFNMSFEKTVDGDISVRLTNISRPLAMAILGTDHTSTSWQDVEAFPCSDQPCLFSSFDGQKLYWQTVDIFCTGTRYKELARKLLPYLPTQQRVESVARWLFKDGTALGHAAKLSLLHLTLGNLDWWTQLLDILAGRVDSL